MSIRSAGASDSGTSRHNLTCREFTFPADALGGRKTCPREENDHD